MPRWSVILIALLLLVRTAAAQTIIATPSLTQPSLTGDVIGMRFENNSGSSTSSGYQTRGQIFKQGDVQPSDTLVGRLIGGSTCPVAGGATCFMQRDIRDTYPDGSVKHAMLTMLVPAITTSPNFLDVMIQKCTSSCPSAPSPAAPSAATLAAGSDPVTSIVFSAGITETDHCTTILAAANAAATTLTVLSGAAVNEFVAKAYAAGGTTVSTGKLRLECHWRAYADGSSSVDVVFANDWFAQGSKTDLAYTITITADSFTHTFGSSTAHPLYTSYDHIVNSGIPTFAPSGDARVDGSGFVYDVPYLIASGASLPYDLTAGTQLSTGQNGLGTNQQGGLGIQDNFNNLSGNTGPMGVGQANANELEFLQGSGDDQMTAPDPNWVSEWIKSQDYRAWANTLVWSNASGTIPWHYTDESTGQPPSIITYSSIDALHWALSTPVLANGVPTESSGGGTPAANGQRWGHIGDVAHHPRFSLWPYVVTGRYYHLYLLKQWANEEIMAVTPGVGRGGRACSTPSIETRAFGWCIRGMGTAAYIVPSSDSTQAYFRTQLDNTLVGIIQLWGNDTAFNAFYGQLQGVLPSPTQNLGNGSQTAYWQLTYVVASLTEISLHHMPTGSTFLTGLGLADDSAAATAMLGFLNNAKSGACANGDYGFDGNSCAMYYVNNVYSGNSADFWCGTTCVNYILPYQTWPAFYIGDSNPPGPIDQMDTGFGFHPPRCEFSSTCNFQPWSERGMLPALARAAISLAGTATQLPMAAEAWAYVQAYILADWAFVGISETIGIQLTSQWDFARQMPDGTYLGRSRFSYDNTAGTVTLSGDNTGPWFLASFGGSGAKTFTMGTKCDAAFGGGTTNTFNLGAGTACQYAIAYSGATGPNVFNSNTGTHFMKGGYGADAAHGNTFNIGSSATSGSDTIQNFNPTIDTLGVHTDGASCTSAATVVANCMSQIGTTTRLIINGKTVDLPGIRDKTALTSRIAMI